VVVMPGSAMSVRRRRRRRRRSNRPVVARSEERARVRVYVCIYNMETRAECGPPPPSNTSDRENEYAAGGENYRTNRRRLIRITTTTTTVVLVSAGGRGGQKCERRPSATRHTATANGRMATGVRFSSSLSSIPGVVTGCVLFLRGTRAFWWLSSPHLPRHVPEIASLRWYLLSYPPIRPRKSYARAVLPFTLNENVSRIICCPTPFRFFPPKNALYAKT